MGVRNRRNMQKVSGILLDKYDGDIYQFPMDSVTQEIEKYKNHDDGMWIWWDVEMNGFRDIEMTDEECMDYGYEIEGEEE